MRFCSSLLAVPERDPKGIPTCQAFERELFDEDEHRIMTGMLETLSISVNDRRR